MARNVTAKKFHNARKPDVFPNMLSDFPMILKFNDGMQQLILCNY